MDHYEFREEGVEMIAQPIRTVLDSTPLRAARVLFAFLVVPGAANAQVLDYARIAAAGALLESESGIQIRVLADERTLGGPELEVVEITFPAGAGGGGHRHGATELLYVLSGVLDHVVNGESYRLTPGTLGIVRAGDTVSHRVVSDEPVQALVIWAPGGELDRVRRGFRERMVSPSATPEEGMDRLTRAWTAAYERGDSAAMAELYVEDAVRMPYDARAQQGRNAILAAYGRSFRSRTVTPSIVLTRAELEVHGDMAVERGTYAEELGGAGGLTLLENGTYMTLARRDASGTWRYDWSTFNRDAAPPYRPDPPSARESAQDPDHGAGVRTVTLGRWVAEQNIDKR
jgi:uncharacterized protein (TIGR02246 family)